MKTAILVLMFTTLSVATPGDTAKRDVRRSTPASILHVSPQLVHFGTKQIGTFTLRGARITNTSSQTVNLFVTGSSLPDDFSFGILPGSTAPVFEPEPFEPHQSCRAVVGFRPSEFWTGQQQNAQLLAIATDPVTHEVLDEVLIDFTGTGQ
ncbi:MAG TPA: hypothetical protein VFT55_03805 [Planctomycetota bacterium]|nr:hypothetical protein [Planctomycetota bacterium]